MCFVFVAPDLQYAPATPFGSPSLPAATLYPKITENGPSAPCAPAVEAPSAPDSFYSSPLATSPTTHVPMPPSEQSSETSFYNRPPPCAPSLVSQSSITPSEFQKIEAQQPQLARLTRDCRLKLSFAQQIIAAQEKAMENIERLERDKKENGQKPRFEILVEHGISGRATKGGI